MSYMLKSNKGNKMHFSPQQSFITNKKIYIFLLLSIHINNTVFVSLTEEINFILIQTVEVVSNTNTASF